MDQKDFTKGKTLSNTVLPSKYVSFYVYVNVVQGSVKVRFAHKTNIYFKFRFKLFILIIDNIDTWINSCRITQFCLEKNDINIICFSKHILL